VASSLVPQQVEVHAEASVEGGLLEVFFDFANEQVGVASADRRHQLHSFEKHRVEDPLEEGLEAALEGLVTGSVHQLTVETFEGLRLQYIGKDGGLDFYSSSSTGQLGENLENVDDVIEAD